MITYQGFMIGAQLRKRRFTAREDNDHEHCTMCGIEFSMLPSDLHEGYVSASGEHWVCPECVHEYKSEYRWTIES